MSSIFIDGFSCVAKYLLTRSVVNSSWDAITITGQNDTRAHEKNYLNKKLTPKVINHYQQIDDEFEQPFKTRKNN